MWTLTEEEILSHLDLVIRAVAFVLVVQLDVEIAGVLLVAARRERANDLFSMLEIDHFVEIQNSLLPVGVLDVGTRAKVHNLVAIGKPDVKVRYNGVDVVCTLSLDTEGSLVVDLFLDDVVQVHTLQ